MEKSDEFFDELTEAALSGKHDGCELTDSKIREMMEKYKRMYTLLGTIFSLLRDILPSEQEMRRLNDSVELARKLWIDELEISCTPKAHALFDGHAAAQHRRLNGIGDKTEDFVEKGHQLGLRDERRTWNMKNFEEQQRSQIRHSRRGKQHAIRKIIEEVHTSKKRKLKRLEGEGASLKDERKRAKNEIKSERRDTNFDACQDLFQSNEG